jgi:hypothetical protein
MHHDQQLEHMMKILSAKQVLHPFIKYTYWPEEFRKEPETYLGTMSRDYNCPLLMQVVRSWWRINIVYICLYVPHILCLCIEIYILIKKGLCSKLYCPRRYDPRMTKCKAEHILYA